jgi:hypothetical protein
MKTSKILLLVFIAAAAFTAAVWADPPSRVGRINVLEGQVSFRPGSLDDWAPATLNYPLTAGDRLWTSQGARAEVHVGSAAIRLGEDTDLGVLRLDDQEIQLDLSRGSLAVRLRTLDADESFEVAAPNASISLLRPGTYRIDVADDGASGVAVRTGEAELASNASSVTVGPGQEVSLGDADSGAFDFASAPAPDELDRWSAARDQREDRSTGSRYVSPFMLGYEDLEENGVWRVVPAYGSVWVPRRVPAGWAPYRFGHWAWVDPWGWTWIDEAPWGFAPFHYGRWALVGPEWVWIPGPAAQRPVYAPALVVFIGGAERGFAVPGGEGVGWFPLGPREVYVPPYRVSPAYVSRINIDIGPNIRIDIIDISRVTYVNRVVPGAVTVVPRQAFVMAQPAYRVAVPLSRAQVMRVPVTGMAPTIVPQRESVLARPEAHAVPVPRPPVAYGERPVVIRRSPPPPPVPFADRQRTIQANPGRPFESAPDPEEWWKNKDQGRPGYRVLGGPQQPPQGRPQPQGPQGQDNPPVMKAPPRGQQGQPQGQAQQQPPQEQPPVMQGPQRKPGQQQVQTQGHPSKPQGPQQGQAQQQPPQEQPPVMQGPQRKPGQQQVQPQDQDQGRQQPKGQPDSKGQGQPQGQPQGSLKQGGGQRAPEGSGQPTTKKKIRKQVNGKWVEVEVEDPDNR